MGSRVALVTGGSRGVGAAVVRRLASDGIDVVFSYLNSAEKAKAVAEEASTNGVRVEAMRADAGNETEMAQLVEDTVALFGGRLDILVHNAAVFIQRPLNEPVRDEAAFARQWQTNVHGGVAAVRAATPHMPDGGRIILVSSGAALHSGGLPNGDYAATKAALEAYCRAWAHEFGPRGITVNTLRLGGFDTDMLDRDAADAFLPAVPARRWGRPEEAADAVAYLASPGASYVNGTALQIDGGLGA